MNTQNREQKTVDCGILGMKPVYRFSKKYCERNVCDRPDAEYVIVHDSIDYGDDSTINIVDIKTTESDSFTLSVSCPELEDWLEPAYESNGNSIEEFVDLVKEAGGIVYQINDDSVEVCLLLDINNEDRGGLKICRVDNHNSKKGCLNSVVYGYSETELDVYDHPVQEMFNMIRSNLFIPERS